MSALQCKIEINTRINQWVFWVLFVSSCLIFLCGFIGSSPVYARGSNTGKKSDPVYFERLISMCQGVENIETVAKDDCKEMEDKLKKGDDEALGCSDKMFYSKNIQNDPNNPNPDPNDVTKTWFIKAEAYAGCINMAYSKMRKVSASPCNTNFEKGGETWDKCERMQNRLKEAVGAECDKFLKKVNDDKWTVDTTKVDACKSALDSFKTTVVIKGPDGQTSKINEDGSVTTYDKDGKAISTVDAEDPATSSGGSGTPEAGTQCQGGGLGWLFCPFVDAMTQTVQTTGGLIDSMLNVRFLAVGKNDPQGSSQAIKTITQSILAVANILLVIAFLIIIFSQATQQGLSNYNVKRMLPRLVMAAILMNLSFYICAAAIDLSNIVGGSIMGFILGKGNTIQSALYSATGGSGGTLAALVAGSVALVALMFFLLVPVVLTILAVFAMLVGRQVILMCLVIVSPLAFVAWLLPNTEKYFKKWLDLFVQLLFIYPIIMFVFAVSLFLANLVGTTGDSIIPVPGNPDSSQSP